MWVPYRCRHLLATGGILATLPFGRVAIGLKFTHHFIKNCALENAKLLHMVVGGRFGTPEGNDVTSQVSRLLSEVSAALQEKINK